MRIVITSKLVNASVNEGSSFVATASYFDDSSDVWSATTPTSVRYRIDQINGSDPSCYRSVVDWQALTPAITNAITVSGAQNSIYDDCSYDETRQITVQADLNLATQGEQTYRYRIINLAGSP